MDKYKHRVSFRLEKRKDKSGNLPEELPINADMIMKYVKIPPPATHISPSSLAYKVILMPALNTANVSPPTISTKLSKS